MRQALPGQQVGVVFEGADDDLVAGLELRLQAIGQQVYRLGGAMGEDDLRRTAAVQPEGQLAAGRLEGTGGALAGQVLGAVHVGRAAAVVAGEGIDQCLRLLRRGGAVEVGLAFAIESGEGGEGGAPGGHESHKP
ncbi:hypothetical protein D3C76_1198420 [compost metagenome]